MASFSKDTKSKGVDESKRDLQHLSDFPVGRHIIYECEVLDLEAAVNRSADRWEHCLKNPGHPTFIPIHEFDLEHLPVGHRTPQMMDNVFLQSTLTVRIRITYTSPRRPDTFPGSDAPYPFSNFRGNPRAVRYGTGSILDVFYHQSIKDRLCPCPECRESDNPKTQFWWIRARTVTHLVYDRSEAEFTQLDCFYDSEDRSNVKTIYGYDTFNVHSNSYQSYCNDVCDLLCVTHDRITAAIFDRIIPIDFSEKLSPSTVLVSHPHGLSKHITVGKVFHVTVPIGPEYPVNTAIPFKEGTVFRRRQTGPDAQTNEARLSSQKPDIFTSADNIVNIDNDAQTHTGNDDPKVVDYAVGDCVPNLRDRLEAIRASLDIPPQDNTTNSSTLTPPRQTKEDYLLGFYFSFLRERCLKVAVMLATLNKTWGGGKSLERMVIHGLDYVFRNYLSRRDSQGHPKNLCQGHGENIDDDDDAASGGCGLDSCNSTTHTPNGTKESHSDHLLPLLSNEEGTGVDSCNSGREICEEDNVALSNEGRAKNKDGGKVETSEIISAKWFNLLVRSEEHFLRFLEEKKSSADDRGGGGGSADDSGGGGSADDSGGGGSADDSGGSEGCGGGRCTVPIIVRWFEGIGQILDSIKSEVANSNKGETITEDVLVEAFDQTIEFGRNLMAEIEDRDRKETKNDGIWKMEDVVGIDSGDEKSKKEEEGEEGENGVRNNIDEKAEKERGEGNGDCGLGERVGEETIEFVPEGASFILPSDAEYAFRVYRRSPEWFNFPPGTLMVFSPAIAITDDLNNPNPNVPVLIGKPLFEFRHRNVLQRERRYVTYNTGTCPGSSGASVYCDFLYKYSGGYFPHAGYLGNGVCRSAFENPSYYRNTKFF